MLTLVIGNKNYSSWSLRPWLYLRQSGIPFEERRLALRTEQFASEIAQYDAAGMVPVLVDGEITVWDSLAILEYVSENFREAAPWPGERATRAFARSIACEMHSGFAAIRSELPQNLRRRPAPLAQAPSERCLEQVRRADALWTKCRRTFRDAGPFLFGTFSPVDAMFAPMALRFDTYAIELGEEGRAYVETIRSMPAVIEFKVDAERETERVEAFEL